MPFKRAVWLQREEALKADVKHNVSMPFKRAVWLQPVANQRFYVAVFVSMPFKRAVWLQLDGNCPTVCSADSFNAL